jgi:GT2 family glycosyltransferase
MTSEVVVLCVNRDSVLGVRRHFGGEVRSLTPRHVEAGRELSRLVDEHPDAYIAWYDESIEPYLTDIVSWPALMKHSLEVLHLSCIQRCDLMVGSLGLVDFDSPFLLPGPTDRRYVTWLVSPMCGIGSSKVFRAVGIDPSLGSLSLTLFDFGFRASELGICPYSDPELLAAQIPTQTLSRLQSPLSPKELATLIRRTYGKKWLGFWLFGCMLFERSFHLKGMLKGWAASPAIRGDPRALEPLRPQLASGTRGRPSVEVLICTLNRAQHVLNLLDDLSSQTMLPLRVSIIDQSPDREPSQLAVVVSKPYPFDVRYQYVTWAGVCRARNLGFQDVTSDWILMPDDDVRLSPECIDYLVNVATAYHVDAVNGAVYLPHQDPDAVIGPSFPRIWPTFGCVCLLSEKAIRVTGGFDLRIDGGFGEDHEYGVRLRLRGLNVIYAAGMHILHLKASSGGYRYEFPHPWLGERVQPLPCPKVLYSRRKHMTKPMRQGYMLSYWFRRLAATPVYGWPGEIIKSARQWRSAARWSSWLARN